MIDLHVVDDGNGVDEEPATCSETVLHRGAQHGPGSISRANSPRPTGDADYVLPSERDAGVLAQAGKPQGRFPASDGRSCQTSVRNRSTARTADGRRVPRVLVVDDDGGYPRAAGVDAGAHGAGWDSGAGLHEATVPLVPRDTTDLRLTDVTAIR